MIGENTLSPTEVGIDIAGSDFKSGICAEQIEVKELSVGGNGVIAKYQPVATLGNIYLYDAGTGNLKFTLLRQTIEGYHTIKLDSGDVGDICYVQYKF